MMKISPKFFNFDLASLTLTFKEIYDNFVFLLAKFIL